MAKLEGFLSFRRQPEVIREYLICSTFLFVNLFPIYIVGVAQNSIFKVIDERMTFNKYR